MSAQYNNNRTDQGQTQQQIPQQYKFTAEEIRAIGECNRESFYRRCLPFATVGMAITHLAAKQGYLKPHPRWGMSLKMIGAGFIGWIAGKISYQSKCEEKIMNLPNSKLGEMIRKRKGYSAELVIPDVGSSETLTVFSGTDTLEDQSDLRSPSMMTLDDYRDQPKGLDDSQRPTLDTTFELPKDDEVKKVPRSFTTYDELRRKNHEEHEARLRAARQTYQPSPSYGSGASGMPPSQSSPPPSYGSGSSSGMPAQSTGSSKNPYGDVWDT